MNLGGFDEWVSCDFELEPTFTNQCEERRQCLRHLMKAPFEIETTQSDVLLDHLCDVLKRERVALI